MLLIATLIAVALIFDFLNGLHDAANSIATIVSTRVLSPRYAVAWAAFFNFIAFAVFGLHVAATIGTGIVSPAIIDDAVIFGALMGAIVWNVVTWLAGIPSSSSHALIGGLVGAGLCKGGWNVIVWSGLGKTAAAIVRTARQARHHLRQGVQQLIDSRRATILDLCRSHGRQRAVGRVVLARNARTRNRYFFDF